mmetsp:Transcript_36746/g.92875  ORF Transcript_36746/g.92875 Transcript_36746/m.92875 type:complete len:286 (+) Transcript_36746:865-1722(+)
MAEPTSGCVGPSATSRTSTARLSMGSASATLPFSSSTVPSAKRLSATSGWLGPSAFSRTSRARRSVGSALILPLSCCRTPWLLALVAICGESDVLVAVLLRVTSMARLYQRRLSCSSPFSASRSARLEMGVLSAGWHAPSTASSPSMAALYSASACSSLPWHCSKSARLFCAAATSWCTGPSALSSMRSAERHRSSASPKSSAARRTEARFIVAAATWRGSADALRAADASAVRSSASASPSLARSLSSSASRVCAAPISGWWGSSWCRCSLIPSTRRYSSSASL